ncbi:TPA: hypothetical protein N0F65_004115 [Lagenidium giganteum]|uniref:Uncharacterized protein n=1 Tax=Lagenidium giganteum TaxID=4803 RepID=A0AAV2Z9S0_9STRA|nr:TPA: hypothetical protein N0F65_004115 [Lagenidium giganteum]
MVEQILDSSSSASDVREVPTHAYNMDSGAAPSSPDDELDVGPDADRAGDVGEVEVFPQHEECAAILTMKCGEPLMAVRKKLHDDILITFIPEEGFGVFQSKVERHFSKIGPSYVQEQRAIYLKPSSNATQSKYVQLTKENFETVLRMRWKVARSMKVEFKYEVFCYFVDTSSKKEKKRMSLLKLSQKQQQQNRLLDQAMATAAAINSGMATPSLNPMAGAASTSALGVTGHTTTDLSASNASLLSFTQPNNHQMLAQSMSHALQGYSDFNNMVENGMKRSAGVGQPGLAATAQQPHKRFGNGAMMEASSPERSRKAARTASRNSAAVPGNTVDPREDLAPPHVFQPIPIRINGVIVPIEVDVAALRRCLGLTPPQPMSAAPVTVAFPPSGSPAPSD